MHFVASFARAAAKIALVGGILFVGYLIAIVHATPLTWHEMDIDHSG